MATQYATMILLDVFTFLGRMHPLVVHLPIGFILLGIVFHALAYHRKYAYLDQAVSFIFMLGFVSAVTASVLGYMLSLNGDYGGEVFDNHRVSGIALTLMAGFVYWMTTGHFRKRISFPRRGFSAFVTVTLLILIYVGHLGASLTHGSNYLTLEVLQREKREKPVRIEDALIFEDIVHPIFEDRCGECHNSTKKKGRLSMESLATILKGGKTGPAVLPGNLTESELYRRINLDPSHEDFMPADDKTPLSYTEKEIIRLWIEKAAMIKETRISDLTENKELTQLASSLFGMPASSASQANLTSQNINANVPELMDLRLIDNLRENGLRVRVMLQKPLMLDVTLPSRSGTRMSEIEDDLQALAGNIIWLNLSDNNFIDSELAILQNMSNLEKLRLEKNPVSDSISYFLQNLKYLEAVNLNETKISCACVARLRTNPAISRIYTWKTMCDEIEFER
jgi:uncharacterized membrane protein